MDKKHSLNKKTQKIRQTSLPDFYIANRFHVSDTYAHEVFDRYVSVTEPYFASSPPEERYGVKYLISDMYNQYIFYVDKYFPNAVAVVDSFHVIQWIIRMIDN